MNNNLMFDFSVDREKKTITVKREFAAGLELVWDAWTKPELLDRWWAPKPFKAKTKSMDFRVGGSWLYAMIGPGNATHWSKADYKKIETRKMFSRLDGFCNENGQINPDLPQTLWTVAFSEKEGTSRVNVLLEYKDLADLEQIIKMGFREGFTAGLENLDQCIISQFKV